MEGAATAAGFLAQVGWDLTKDWHNERKACQVIEELFRRQVVDDAGAVPADRLRVAIETAGLTITVTPLPTGATKWKYRYHVEVVKLAEPGDDPRRTRTFRFGTDGAGSSKFERHRS